MLECELLSKCGFFLNYTDSHQAACKGLISQYCKGTKQDQCKRKEYRLKNGSPPPDDMLPLGSLFKG
jgi:hypothetical protein